MLRGKNLGRFFLSVLAVGSILNGKAAAAGVPPELDRAFVDYLATKDFKAFALAVDKSGNWVWGSASQQVDEAEAQRGATRNCEKLRAKHSVSAPCEILAVGNRRVRSFAWPVQEPPKAVDFEPLPIISVPPATLEPPRAGAPAAQTPSAQVSYEQRWVEGTSFVVGTTSELQIWVAFTTGPDPQALLYFTNGSDQSTTVFPTSISATSVKESSRGSVEAAVTVLGPEDYERKIRNKQAWEALLFGAATALANRPQPQTTTYQGGVSMYQANRPRNEWEGTYYGQITVWPTSADYAAASARSAAQIDAMGEQLRASYAAMTTSLLRNHTMPPHSFYGGIVHFERFKAQRINLAIPFGGTVFNVYFTLP